MTGAGRVVIYTRALCGYCSAALRLLRKKGVDFDEIDVTFRPALRKQMIERASGRSTVPQIFIDGAHIGGYDELAALDRAGKLDELLDAQPD
ncbi:MAG TPA: glutaredoxin 3 [Chromatiales bacterium]|nr:glutaredoxin 3 [Chromatiales bacterium]